MFSPCRRALGRLARTWLGILGILSITGLLATTNSLNLTPAWLQPVQYALAQSDTATPTVVPQPDAPPNPTVGLGEPPLTLQSSGSVANAVAGEQFSFTTTIAANSVEPRAVELRASIDGQLELLSVSGGSCSGGAALSCRLSVQRGQPATIVAAVRVRSGAAAGSRLVYQALAQDDLSNTAASDQVVVMIATPPPAPTTVPPAPPAPLPSSPPAQSIPATGPRAPAQPTTIPTSRPARTVPTAVPVSDAKPVAQNPSASITLPTVLALPIVPAAITLPSANAASAAAPTEGATQADSWLVWAPTQAADSAAPPLVVPEQEVAALDQAASADMPAAPVAPVAVPHHPIVQLPNTAVAPPSAGLAALLVGFALTIHGLRRVRRAAAQLDRQGAALSRLVILMKAAARRRARMKRDERC